MGIKQEENKMNIVVEFDGGVVEIEYPGKEKEIPYAFYILTQLQIRGHEIIMHTNRKGDQLKSAIQFCRKHHFEFDGILVQKTNLPEMRWEKQKIDHYINGKSLQDSSWMDIFWQLNPGELDDVKIRRKKRKLIRLEKLTSHLFSGNKK
jgi:hypothetical protein